MDADKLRNSCICGNAEPYTECCGAFAERPPVAEATDAGGIVREFRHDMHELHMHLFPLRLLYQQYWDTLTRDEYPHHTLMEDGDYGRAIVENFFWDYSVQYSDARPILRSAREVEGRNLRLAHDLVQWSYAPLWPYYVVENEGREAFLRNLGNEKSHRVLHDGRFPPSGHGVWLRILPYRGLEVAGMARLATPEPVDPSHLEAMLRAGIRDVGVKPTSALRPDVHCDEWRLHGTLFLAQWRQLNYDAEVGRPSRALTNAPVTELPLPKNPNWVQKLLEQPGVTLLSENRFELRYRHLPLCRLELRSQGLNLSLFDPVFAPKVARMLAPAGIVGGIGLNHDAVSEDGLHAIPAAWDAWLHHPDSRLGGQTPIQASTHDFGRKKLLQILQEMAKQGQNTEALRRHLSLE